MKNKIVGLLISIPLLIVGCGSDKQTESTAQENPEEQRAPIKNLESDYPSIEVVNENDAALAKQISRYLSTDLLTDELEYLLPEQRTFQYSGADLNDDGTMEYVVEFRNSYFCGSGGCTYILMTSQGKAITQFTVSQSPFYVLNNKTNGWYDLIIPQGGEFNIMKFTGSSYPSNPSVEPVVKLEDADIIGTLTFEGESYGF